MVGTSMNNAYSFSYYTKIGHVEFVEKNRCIAAVSLVHTGEHQKNTIVQETSLIQTAASQLQEYLDGKRREFSLPLLLEGTPFQKAVWKALLDIPYGETRSYRDIAETIGNPKAVRAVGMANNRNPISFIVPCHRVIGADGSLVGYGGGLALKQQLLDLEKSVQATTFSS